MNPTMAVIWSLFAMYLVVRYLNHRKFKNDMDRILREVVETQVNAKLNRSAEPLMRRLLETQVKEYLLESKVVDKSVQFRWSKERA